MTPLEASILAVASAIAWAAASDGKYLPFELHGYLRMSWMRKLQQDLLGKHTAQCNIHMYPGDLLLPQMR
jgi:hypothetical protein